MSDQDINQYKGKFIDAELASHPGESREYKVEEAAGGFVILREKGKSQPALHTVEDVLAFVPPAPKPPTPIKARRVNPVPEDQVKWHLINNHGYRVTDINSITVEQAVVLHDGIDHTETDAGHFHAVSKREQAIAEGGPSSDATESQNEDQLEAAV